MFHKTLIAVAATLALGTVPMATAAFAGPHGGHYSSGHGYAPHYGGGHRYYGGGGYYRAGPRYYGGGYYGGCGYYGCRGYGYNPGAAIAAGVVGGALGALGGY